MCKFPWFIYRLFTFADEKEKYNPSAFRDAIVQGLNEAGNDIDQVSALPVSYSCEPI